MVIDQTRVLPVDTTVSAEDGPSLERLDLLMRYIMTAVGCLPASCIPQLPKSAKIPLAIAHLLMTIVLFIPPVNALFSIMGMDAGQDPTLSIYKILCLEITFLTPFDALCFSVTANLFNTFTDYYEQLSVVQKCFSKMHINIPHRFMRYSLVMLANSGLLMSGVMVTLFIYDYLHPLWHLDPLFAPEITEENYTALDQFQFRLRQLGQVYMVMYCIHTSIKITYLGSVILVISLLFRSYNKNLENIVNNDPNKLQEDLPLYRHTHLELCQLVKCMNRLFRCLLGCMVLAYSVGTLLILYLVSLGLTKDSELRGIMIFWCILFISFDLMTIISCQVIQDQTVEAKEHLLRLTVTPTEQKVEEFELSLFFEQVSEPTPLTAAGVTVVNKDLGLTIAGFILTYYILMAQIGSSLQGTECPNLEYNLTSSSTTPEDFLS